MTHIHSHTDPRQLFAELQVPSEQSRRTSFPSSLGSDGLEIGEVVREGEGGGDASTTTTPMAPCASPSIGGLVLDTATGMVFTGTTGDAVLTSASYPKMNPKDNSSAQHSLGEISSSIGASADAAGAGAGAGAGGSRKITTNINTASTVTTTNGGALLSGIRAGESVGTSEGGASSLEEYTLNS